MSAPSAQAPSGHRRNFEALRHERVDGALALAQDGFAGYAWPWPSLNRLADTIMPADLLLIGAPTGVGKTTFGIQLAHHLAAHRITTFYTGTEQRHDALTMKMCAAALGIDFADARRGRLTPAERDALLAAIEEQREGKAYLHFYPESSPTADQVLTAIRAAARHGTRVFILDYLGRFDLDGGREEWRGMKRFVKALKDLAVELDVAIVALQQVGKSEAAGTLLRYMKPDLASFMGGQAVTHEADVVLGLYQPLRPDVTNDVLKAYHRGLIDIQTIVEPHTACVTLLKRRDDSKNVGAVALFWVVKNRFFERAITEATLPAHLNVGFQPKMGGSVSDNPSDDDAE